MKKPARWPAFFRIWVPAQLQRAYLRVQAAFVARGLVFVNQPFTGEVVEQRHGAFVGGFGGGFIASFNGVEHFFHFSAHFAATTSVALAA